MTRSRAQASDLAEGLIALGACVFEFPTIRIVPSEHNGLALAVEKLASGQLDWVVLTSVNGVDALFVELQRQHLDARAFKAKAAAVGSATAQRLKEHGVNADLIPPEYVAESIVATLQARESIAGRKFLLARADIARSELPAALKQLGGEVSDVEAYKTILETAGQEQALAALDAGEIDAVTFTSASTARNFAAILGPDRLRQVLAGNTKFLSIGPVTSNAMKECGIPIHGEAPVHNIEGLIELCQSILKHFH